MLTVPFTFAATVEAIVRCGATPLFVDIGDDYTIDVDAAAALLAKRPAKAIIAVHLYGQPADLDRLVPLARRHGAALIEDAAQAHGAWCTVAGARRRVGTIGDAGCFSFYPTKNLGAPGDAGAVVTSRDDVAARVRLIANHGERTKYEHVIPDGRNSRLDAIHAAVLRVKLRHLDAWNGARRAVASRYTAGARRPAGRDRRASAPASSTSTTSMPSARPHRDALRQALTERGIGTGIHYPLPLHLQEGYRRFGYAAGALAGLRTRGRRGAVAADVAVPRRPQIDEVIAAVRAALT